MGWKSHPGLVCGVGYLAGMPDLSPEDRGHQGHRGPTPRCASERSCKWSWTCWFRQSILRTGQSHSIGPVQEIMVERRKIDSLKPKLWRDGGRNSGIVLLVQLWKNLELLPKSAQTPCPCSNSIAGMTWYNQHKDCAKFKCGKIKAVELWEETFVGWLVGEDAVMFIHAGVMRRGTEVKQACNLSHAQAYCKFWAYLFQESWSTGRMQEKQ